MLRRSIEGHLKGAGIPRIEPQLIICPSRRRIAGNTVVMRRTRKVHVEQRLGRAIEDSSAPPAADPDMLTRSRSPSCAEPHHRFRHGRVIVTCRSACTPSAFRRRATNGAEHTEIHVLKGFPSPSDPAEVREQGDAKIFPSWLSCRVGDDFKVSEIRQQRREPSCSMTSLKLPDEKTESQCFRAAAQDCRCRFGGETGTAHIVPEGNRSVRMVATSRTPIIVIARPPNTGGKWNHGENGGHRVSTQDATPHGRLDDRIPAGEARCHVDIDLIDEDDGVAHDHTGERDKA